MPTLRDLVPNAIKATSPSLESLAARLGLSSSALRRYRLGNREPSVDTVQSLAVEMRRQASHLLRLAERLERATTNRRSDA